MTVSKTDSPPEGKSKLVIVGPVHPFRGGIALFLGHVYESIADDFDVEVISFKRLYPKLLFPGKTEYDRSNEPVKTIPGARFIINSANPLTWFKAWRIITSMKPAPRLLVFSWWNPFFALLYSSISKLSKRSTGCKVLYFCENLVSHEGKKLDRLLTRIGVGQADMAIVLSGEVERELMTMFPELPVGKAALPVYTCFKFQDDVTTGDARKDLGLASGSKILLFFGYVRKYKGLEYLLKALPRAAANVDGLRLVIVGEFYEPRQQYDRIITELGIEELVTIVDRYVRNEEVQNYFKAADLVVLPYVTATQSGISQIARAFGKQVLSTRVGGLPESIKEGIDGYLVPPRDPNALAEKIMEFFNGKKIKRQTSNDVIEEEEKVDRIATLVKAAACGDPEGLYSSGRISVDAK